MKKLIPVAFFVLLAFVLLAFAQHISTYNAGVFTNTQPNMYNQSQVGSTEPGGFFFTSQGGYNTDAFTGIVTAPVGATAHQFNGINAAVLTSAVSSPLGANENAVGVYGAVRNMASNTAGWAFNGTCGSNGGFTGTLIVCNEMDVGLGAGDQPTRFQGYFLTSGNIGGAGAVMASGPVMGTVNVASNSASAYGLALGTSSTVQFPVAFWSARGSAAVGLMLDANAYTGAAPSQSIQLGGNDGATAHTATLQASSTGDLVVTPDTGRGFRVATATFSQLPTCVSGLEGSMRPVTDANTATWGANITAGSSTNHVLAYCDGSNWTVAAK